MPYKYRFSIFTATYNRGDRLCVLFNLLKAQSFKAGFEWVIVSDGSVDNTSEYVASFIKEASIPITFIDKKTNEGKHSAWRAAMDKFQGRYIITCDDDDLITCDMLAVFDKHWHDLELSDCYKDFWEIRSRVVYENGQVIGNKLPAPYFDSDYNTVTFKIGIVGEMVGCRKTEVLKKEAAVPDTFSFDDKCSNFPEGIRWSRAARHFKTRYIPDITRTYVVGHDSLCVTPQGVKRSYKKDYNSLVYALYSLNEQSDLLIKYQKRKYLRLICQLAYSSIRVNESVYNLIQSGSNRILFLLCFFPMWILFYFRQFMKKR